MDLLERDAELDELLSALGAAAAGKGRVVLVTGEAGIGKTRLVNEFLNRASGSARILWGACDDLDTPRLLGPIRDIALRVGGPLEALLTSGGSKSEIFGPIAEALDAGALPTIAVVEDAHWVDAATVDVLKYLGRRIERLRLVLIITYRSDEVIPGHPLRSALGDLPPDGVVRLPLTPLSPDAVDSLASAAHRSGEDVYDATNGNPFLTIEMLAAETEAVPTNVFDAIVARVSRLDTSERSVVEFVSMVPGRCERRLLPDAGLVLDAGRAASLLDHDDETVWFRHELARRAVEESVPQTRRRALNAAVTEALVAASGDPARIVHHAERAGDIDRILRFAPAAARAASAVAAHREAAAHYRSVLAHADLLEPKDLLDLLAEHTVECYYLDDQPAALQAAESALALSRQLGDIERQGQMLRWMSRIHWWLGDPNTATDLARESIDALEALPPGTELAMAYSNLSQIHMLAHDTEPAVRWAHKAIGVARSVGNHAAHAHALNNLGSALVRSGDPDGLDMLLDSLSLSRREGLDEHAGRAYANSIWVCLERRDYDTAEQLLDEGLAFATERELQGDEHYMTAERAWLRFDRGEWDAAERDARWVLSRQQAPGITTLPALITLARIKVRRGDEDAAATLNEAWKMAEATGELQRIAPAALGRAEAAWLHSDVKGIREALGPPWKLIGAAVEPWLRDELASWRWRTGDLDPEYEMTVQPLALQFAGEWSAAAEAWDALGCPYERGIALLDSGDADAMLQALDVFHGLGAQPAAAITRTRLRGVGVTGVPRGPRPTTRAHRGGLTRRQVEVLELVANGLTNAEIGERLFISTKTVDHHVSAILTKLDVESRRQAARWWATTGDPDPT